MVRRTSTLRDFETADGYLYTKETKSSFEIEHIKPASTRTERFVALHQLAEQKDFCERICLIELQIWIRSSAPFREWRWPNPPLPDPQHSCPPGPTSQDVMFPIVAFMLKDSAGYKVSPEAFSRQLMPLVEYSLDEEGRMTVHNDTAGWCRYIDMTPELAFLAHY